MKESLNLIHLASFLLLFIGMSNTQQKELLVLIPLRQISIDYGHRIKSSAKEGEFSIPSLISSFNSPLLVLARDGVRAPSFTLKPIDKRYYS